MSRRHDNTNRTERRFVALMRFWGAQRNEYRQRFGPTNGCVTAAYYVAPQQHASGENGVRFVFATTSSPTKKASSMLCGHKAFRARGTKLIWCDGNANALLGVRLKALSQSKHPDSNFGVVSLSWRGGYHEANNDGLHVAGFIAQLCRTLFV